ncbi:MAG: lysophospholipase [Bauldia sp.]|nr:lysophospholipase [Bauldia sp.]
MTVIEERIDSTGGVKIYLRSWKPAGKPKAIVVICHGFNSHGGLYIWTAEQLVADGYSVYALDLRGRGKSEGPRFYVDTIADYVGDVATVVRVAKTREPGLPLFLLGHSAGGVISVTYALDHQAELAGLICESFAYRVPAPGIVLSLLKGMSAVAPRLGVFKLKNSDFSRDPAMVALLNSDPLIANESQPAATAAALIRASERLKREFSRITLPVFILHGTMDKATVPAGSQEFAAAAASKDKTLKLYEGHFHDLLADVGKEGVMADIKAWIAARVPGAAA